MDDFNKELEKAGVMKDCDGLQPSKDGKRVREYIGAQPERINEALAAVRREQRYQEVCRELQDIEEKIRTSTFKLDSFLWELARVPQDQRKLVGHARP